MKIRHASQAITVAIVAFSLLAICCLLLARRSWTIAQRAYETCRVMLADADRLAAGSDRLTGAVRAYAATGDRRHYEEFERELRVDRNRDRALEQLRLAGLTVDEEQLVARAKKNSDRLVALEDQAFAAVGRGDVSHAIRIVYGPEYAAAKTSIMEPIAEFRRTLEKRLTENASGLAHRAVVFDSIALVMLTLNALSMLAALVLFYQRRIVDPLGRIARSLDRLARNEDASIGFQQDSSEIGDVARAIETYRLAIAEAEHRTREALDQVRTSEAELRHTNFLADTALELTQSGYWHVPLDGSGWYNSSERAARIFGDLPAPDHRYRLEEWTQHVFAGDEAAAKVTMENFSAAVAGTIPSYDATYAYRRPVDGRIVWIHALGHVVKDAGGKPADMYGVTQDVTEFKRLEMALVDAIRAESELARHRSVAQMVAGVAHELNTPLGIINTASDLMMQRLSSPDGELVVEDLVEAGNLIARNVARAHKLVQDFKKVSVNQITDVRETVRLPDVIAETAGLFKVSARQSRIDVSIINELPEQRGEWTGYAGSLSQVLLNLLSNIQRYAYAEGAGGRVEIRLSSEDGAYCITVRDFGSGIPPENLTRVFDPFFTTGRGKGGSGLGMSIVHNIVTVHLHGTISVDSKVGEGTTVTIRMPAIVPAN